MQAAVCFEEKFALATDELVESVCQNPVFQKFDMAVDSMPEESAGIYASGCMESLVNLPFIAGDLYNVAASFLIRIQITNKGMEHEQVAC